MAELKKSITTTLTPGVVPVEIVRPRNSTPVMLFVSAVMVLLRSAMVMWFAPLATAGAWTPSFWQAWAAAIVAGWLFHPTADYVWWTKDPR